MNTPLVSVVIPVYKAEKYLRTCVESVLHQTYTNWEIILVDDGSPDNCSMICDEFASADSRIFVIHKENGGLSSARNVALDVVKGMYVTFLDSDDFWSVDYLSTLMGLALKENADIVQCSFVRGVDTSFPQTTVTPTVVVCDNHTVFTKQKAKIIMCGKIYLTSLFDGLRMPEGIINEDDWTTWKLYYRAKKIVVTNQPMYYYTYNANSIMGVNKKKPNLIYFGAYKERINFFANNKEVDLEHVSRMQFCKSLVSLYANPMLEGNHRKLILSNFKNCWKVIRFSNVVPFSFKVLFVLMNLFPMTTSLLIQKIRK